MAADPWGVATETSATADPWGVNPVSASPELLASLQDSSQAADRSAMTHRPFSRGGAVIAADRLPGNILKSAGAQASSMIAGVGEYWNKGTAEYLDRQAKGPNIVSLVAPETAAHSSALGLIEARKRHQRAKEFAAIGREARLGAQEAIPADAGVAERNIQQGVASGLLSLPIVMATGPIAAPVILGAGAGGEQFSQMQAAGKPYGESANSALRYFGLEASTEYLPAKALLRSGSAIGKRFLEFLVTDVGGENITTLGELWDDHFTGLRPNVTIGDVAIALRDTTLSTLAGSGVQVGAAHVVDSTVRKSNELADARKKQLELDPWAVKAVAEQGLSARGAPLAPQTTTPDTTVQPIAPDQHFLGNRLDMSTAQTLRGGYDTTQPVPATVTAAKQEADPWDVAPTPTASAPTAFDRVATDPDLRYRLESMKGETGWYQVGGHAVGLEKVGEDWKKVEGRTQWIPRYPWYKDRPTNHNAKQTQLVIEKMLAGKRLGSEQLALAKWLAEVAADDIQMAPKRPTTDELKRVGLESNLGDANEVALAARALAIDSDAFERLTIQYADDDAGYLRALRKLVDDQNAAPGSVREAGSPAQKSLERDLFAGSDAESESLARRNALAAEQARLVQTSAVPVETGNPNDLFSNARNQTDLTDTEDGVQAMRDGPVNKLGTIDPGAMWTGKINPHAAPQTVTLGVRANDQRTLDVPEKPIRREHIMEEFQRKFGVKVYQGKPFKVKALGFFRPKNFEVRVLHHNNLETTAHEVFHWLDRTYPTIRALYHQPRFSEQLKSVSYNKHQLVEGFAEFGRLFMTQESEAAARTPEFYDAFVAEAKKLGIYDRMRFIQDRMHQWFAQGAELRAASKMGQEKAPFKDRAEAFKAEAWDKLNTRALDYLNPAKIIERVTAGELAADATQSLYKELRLLGHARTTAEAVINYGTPRWNARGDLEFSGDGLRQIFEPVADSLDDAMSYFTGMRAAELRKYGKENLFKPDEIQALINRGMNSPRSAEIKTAFIEYQKFNERMLDFAGQSGIISSETRELWRKMYQNYVPFYRVRDVLASGVGGAKGSMFKRLTGGTQNLQDVYQNIVHNTELIVLASLRNHAKTMLFKGIEQSKLGQKYAVAIPTDIKPVNIGMTQVEQSLRGLIDEAKKASLDSEQTDATRAHYAQVAMALDILTGATNAAGESSLASLQAQATFFLTGQPPGISDRDFYLKAGKPVWFQIGDQELMRMLEALNTHRPLHLVEKMFGIASNTLRRGITSLPDFQIPNLIRDMMNGFVLSAGGQKPFVDALVSVKNIVTVDENLRLFFLNGGGFGLQQGEIQRALKLELERVRKANGGMNIRAILDTPAKLMEFYDKFSQVSELATRVAEFKAVRKKGGSAREAAFQANEVSTDFAAHGSDPALTFIRRSVPFLNARAQGLQRLLREAKEHPARLAMRAGLAITIPSLLLYWRNKDEERYKSLAPETRALYWVLLDDENGVWLVPKPFEVGALFATTPEVAWDQFENGHDKRTVDALKFMLFNTFAFNPTPQLIKPPLDLAMNKDWRGYPITPEGLESVDPAEQFNAYTSRSMTQVGQMFGVSPIKLDYLVRGYLGTLGAYLLTAADALIKTNSETGPEPSTRTERMPVIRRFRREEPYSRTQYELDFYQMLDESRRVVATGNHMRKTLRVGAAENYLTDPEREGSLGRADALNRINSRVTVLNDQMKLVRFSPDYSAKEKRQLLDELQAAKNELFRAGAQAFAQDGQ